MISAQNRFLFFLVFGSFLFPLKPFSQTPDTTAFQTFEKALEYYENQNLDSALSVFKYIVENDLGKNTNVYGYSYFNIPTIYWTLEEFDKSKEWYKRILDSDLRDSDETGRLMEPHTNYKHNSAMSLASLYAMDSNYTEGLKYVWLADTTYRYWGFEGSSTNITIVQTSLIKSKLALLRLLEKPEEIRRVLITELICAPGGFFASFDDSLFNYIDSTDFRKTFDKALKKMKVERHDSAHWTATFTMDKLVYEIPIQSVFPDRNIPHYWRIHFIKSAEEAEKQNIIKYIQSLDFYKRLP